MRYKACKEESSKDTWRVEIIDRATGALRYIATFSGDDAEERALNYERSQNEEWSNFAVAA